MGWNTFTFAGSAAAQADDAELCGVAETGDSSLSLPYDIALQDIVLTSALASNHQFSFFVNGKKQSSNLYAAEINPTAQTRFNIAAQNVRIPKGSKIQIKTSQKAGAIEPGSLTLVYTP